MIGVHVCTTLSCNFLQELIGGLEILHPAYGDDYYPTDTDIRFEFNVSNGTSVTYTLDTGNGTRLNTSRYLNVSYTRRGTLVQCKLSKVIFARE